MSFKALNDSQRRAAIVPFLKAANCINGWLVTFAISKAGGSLFATNDSPPPQGWKVGVHERLARVVHLGSYLLAGLAQPNQDAYWITDEDEIAANSDQLARVTQYVANVSSHFLTFNLRHLKCATTNSDNGDYELEDTCAVCDLVAGATAEVLTSVLREKQWISQKLMLPLPPNVSLKSRLIMSWLANQSRLRRITVQIDLDTAGSGFSSRFLEWHAVPGTIVPVRPV